MPTKHRALRERSTLKRPLRFRDAVTSPRSTSIQKSVATTPKLSRALWSPYLSDGSNFSVSKFERALNDLGPTSPMVPLSPGALALLQSAGSPKRLSYRQMMMVLGAAKTPSRSELRANSQSSLSRNDVSVGRGCAQKLSFSSAEERNVVDELDALPPCVSAFFASNVLSESGEFAPSSTAEDGPQLR
jgi:hypothetical protein